MSNLRKDLPEVEGSLADLKSQFVVSDRMQKHKGLAASNATGCIEVAFYRGEQHAYYKIYEMLKKNYPIIAEYVRKNSGYSG